MSASGEWHIFEHYRNTAGERTRVLDSFGVLVAETQTEAQAVQVVANHAAVERLVEALIIELTDLGSRKAIHADAPSRHLFDERIQRIRAALATVADRGREVGDA